MLGNVIQVCDSCTIERIKKMQQNTDKAIAFIEDQIANHGGACVKFAFSQEGKPNENMWVVVKRVDHRNMTLIGNVDNDPFELTNIKCNDEVERLFNEMIEVFGLEL